MSLKCNGFYIQENPNVNSSLNDEDYLQKQLEAQSGLKRNLVLKFEAAKVKYDAAMVAKSKKDAQDKVEAYNIWRQEEEKRGRAQDEHGKSLVKVMLDCAKTEDPPNPLNRSVANVLANVDGMCFIYT